jgi:hypothetical protein
VKRSAGGALQVRAVVVEQSAVFGKPAKATLAAVEN